MLKKLVLLHKVSVVVVVVFVVCCCCDEVTDEVDDAADRTPQAGLLLLFKVGIGMGMGVFWVKVLIAKMATARLVRIIRRRMRC